MHKKSRSYKKTEKGVSGLLGLFLTECFLTVAAEIFRELHSFRTTGYRIFSKKWRGAGRCRMVFLH